MGRLFWIEMDSSRASMMPSRRKATSSNFFRSIRSAVPLSVVSVLWTAMTRRRVLIALVVFVLAIVGGVTWAYSTAPTVAIAQQIQVGMTGWEVHQAIGPCDHQAVASDGDCWVWNARDGVAYVFFGGAGKVADIQTMTDPGTRWTWVKMRLQQISAGLW